MIIAATGHRPNKLGGYTTRAGNILYHVAEAYLAEMKPTTVISGMALGWDQSFALAADDLGIPFIAAIPFNGQESAWPLKSQQYYKWLLNKASKSIVVTPGAYAAWKMQARNKWMVDQAERICALYDGTSGGTQNCVKYAESQNKPIDNLYSRWVECKEI